MKSTSDRRQMVKWTKQQIRKADRRKVKYQSFKQNDRDRAIISTLASPCSKAPLSPVEGSAKCVRKIFIQINELIEGRAFRSEQLFEVVDVLKSLFSKANEEENGPAATELYQHITAKECSTLSRLMSPDVCERTQVKTMGIFLELSYSPFAHLILHSPQALEKIVLTLSAKNKALRVRAVGCIANLVEDGKERDFLVGIPEVITGL